MTERGGGPSTMSLRYNSMFWNGIIWNNGGSGGGVISPPNDESYWSIAVDSGEEPIGNAFPVNVRTDSCGSGWYGSIQEYATWEIVDSRGTYHQFQLATTFTQNCASATGVAEYPNGYGAQIASGQATDGSGYFISIHNGNAADVYSPDGSLSGVTPNGNQAYINSTLQGPGSPGTGTDALPGLDAGCIRNSSSVAQPYAPQGSQMCHLTYRPLNGAQTAAISYILTFAYVPVCTGFYSTLDTTHQAYDYCGGIWALQSLAMPDGVSTYSFTYDTGTTPGHYGQLLSMTLPTGGSVSYSYYAPTGAGTSYQSDFRSDIKTVTDYGGMTSFARTFCSKTDYCAVPFVTATITPPAHATDPSEPGSIAQDQTIYTTSTSTSGNIVSTMLTEQDYLNGAIVTTETLDTTNIGTPAFSSTMWSETGYLDRLQYQYTTGDVVSRADEYLNGDIYRSVLTQYQQDTSTIPYVSQYHMVNYPILTKVLDYGGNVVAQESRTYDEYGASYCNVAPVGLSAIPMLTNITGAIGHADVNFGSSRWARGNPTTISRSTSSTTSVTTHACYDTLGNVTQTVDANGNPTRFGYVDNYTDTSCISSSTKTYAFPTLVTDALGHQKKTSYNSCLREPVQVQDANDLASVRLGEETTYDTQGRALCTSYADGGQTCRSYTSATSSQLSQLVAGTTSHTITTTLNSFGEIGSVVDLATKAEVDKTYDNVGRLSSMSNPYTTGGSASLALTSYGYDGFGRTLAVVNPDMTKQSFSYVGTIAYSSDENGVSRRLPYDTLGRLTATFDTGTSVTPISLDTDYTYNSLNNVVMINQKGAAGEAARTRNFTYDWLSRPLCASNPETATAACPHGTSAYTPGTVGYTYDANGNVSTKVDARGVKITYSYDALNRLTGKTYSDGTPGEGFGYDGKDASGATLSAGYGATSNVIGRLTYASHVSNADEAFGYDAMGRITKETYCLPVDCSNRKTVSVSYNLAGGVASLTYPDGRTIQRGFDAAGRVNTINYLSWNGMAVNQAYLTASNGYDAAGHVGYAIYGNGTQYFANYDNRERVAKVSYGPPGPLWSKQYAWTPNSNLQSESDLVTGVQRQYNYDNLNRLTLAQDIYSNLAVSSSANGNTTSTTTSGSGAEQTPGGTGALPDWTNPDDSNLLGEIGGTGSSWTASSSVTVTPNAGVAPDGTSAATQILAASSASGSASIYIQGYISTPSDYSLESMAGSVWLKSSDATSPTINLYLMANGTAAASTPIQLSQTWQQVSLTATMPANLTALYFEIGGGGTISAGHGVLVWNPMLEDHGIAGSSVTNYLPYSQLPTAPTWNGASYSAFPSTAAAPDGSQTASTVTLAAGGAGSYIADGVANPASLDQQSVVGSVFLEAVSGTIPLTISVMESTGGAAVACGHVSVTLTASWQRVRVACTAQSALSTLYLQLGGAVLTSSNSFQMWGAQMELALAAGPYVATGSIPATRETSLTNLLPYSEQMRYSPGWQNAQNAVSTTPVAAPDGSLTAAQISAPAGGNNILMGDFAPTPELADGATATGSVYLRWISGPTTASVGLNSVSSAGANYLSLSSVTLSSAWQRFQTTVTLPSGLTSLSLVFGGTAGQVYQAWGAQLEIAPHAGPYVATSTLPIITGSDPTNILPNSQLLSGPNWSTFSAPASTVSVATNAASPLAPDNTPSAAVLSTASTTTDGGIKASVPNPSLYDNESVTASVYLRSNTAQSVVLYLQTIGSQGSLAAAQTTAAVTTSWKRFALPATLQNGLTYLALQVGGGGSIKAGQSIQIWGAQFVIGSAPAPYMDTNNTTTVYATGATGTLVPTGLNQTYSYDSFGNILQNGSFESSYTAKNQMFGYAYDAAGNLLSDGMNIMTWDAESRMVTTAGATYIYDGEGNRVEKRGSTVTDTVYFGGQPLARYASGMWTDLIYGPNGLLAEVPGTQNGVPLYRATDYLGNVIGSLLSNGTFVNPIDHTPFGQVFMGSTSDPYLFTGKERDTESGLDHFEARNYASTMGRWMSPDPAGNSVADFANPQSWNMYSYVLNNPLKYVDPFGLDCAYLNDAGNGVESSDRSSSIGECGKTGGYWVSGAVNSVGFRADGTMQFGNTSTGADGTLQVTVYDKYLGPNTDNSLSSAYGAASSLLSDFLTGSGPDVRNYDLSTIEGRNFLQSKGVQQLNARIRAGCAAGQQSGKADLSSGQAAANIPYDAAHSPVGGQVGGYGGGSYTNNGDSTNISFTNIAGAKSFNYHATPDRPSGSTGPERSITQNFSLSEPNPCTHP